MPQNPFALDVGRPARVVGLLPGPEGTVFAITSCGRAVSYDYQKKTWRGPWKLLDGQVVGTCQLPSGYAIFWIENAVLMSARTQDMKTLEQKAVEQLSVAGAEALRLVSNPAGTWATAIMAGQGEDKNQQVNYVCVAAKDAGGTWSEWDRIASFPRSANLLIDSCAVVDAARRGVLYVAVTNRQALKAFIYRWPAEAGKH